MDYVCYTMFHSLGRVKLLGTHTSTSQNNKWFTRNQSQFTTRFIFCDSTFLSSARFLEHHWRRWVQTCRKEILAWSPVSLQTQIFHSTIEPNFVIWFSFLKHIEPFFFCLAAKSYIISVALKLFIIEWIISLLCLPV